MCVPFGGCPRPQLPERFVESWVFNVASSVAELCGMDLFAGDTSGRSVGGSTRERTRSTLGAADPTAGGGGRSRSASTSTSVSVTSAVDTDRGSARMDVPSSAAVTAMAQIDLDSDPSIPTKDGVSGGSSGLAAAASDTIAASAGRANLWQLARLQVTGGSRALGCRGNNSCARR